MSKKLVAIACLAATVLAACFTPSPVRAESAPITVTNGVLMRNGAPYRAIGMNYYDAFDRYLRFGDTSYRAGFQELAAAGIPFIRFWVLPYYPVDSAPYVNNPTLFYQALDTFVADAEIYNIGLVPCIFWQWTTMPDLMGEPVSAWGDANSFTRTTAESIAQSLAARYANSRAIWMWEMSNEVSDWADVSTAYTYFGTNSLSGQPAIRTTADNYTSAQLLSAYTGFASAIRRGDPTRLVESGHNIPRANAYHRMISGGTNTTLDTISDFNAFVAATYTPGDFVTMHLYPQNLAPYNTKRFSGQTVTAEQFLPYAMSAATAAGKPFFLGEYGTPDDGTSQPYSTSTLSFAEFQSLTNTVISILTSTATSSGLAAVWVYDAPSSTDRYNITGTIRSERLALISQANQTLSTPYWNFNSNTQGWTVNYQISGLACNNGCLEGTFTGTDPRIASSYGCAINTAVYNTFVIRMKTSSAGTVAKLFWITTEAAGQFTSTKSKTFPLTPSSDYTTYTIDMSAEAGWTGTVQQVRFDIVDTGATSGSTFSIDSIDVKAVPKSSYSWEFATSTENWIACNHISNLVQNNGCLEGSITGIDPYIASRYGYSINASFYNTIVIRMKNTSPGTAARLFWITTENSWAFTTARTKNFAIVPNSDYTTYVIDMSNEAAWTGNVRQLRFDVVDTGATAGSSFSIDSIRIVPNMGALWDFDYSTEGWYVLSQITGLAATNSCLQGTSTGVDPYVASRSSKLFDATINKTVKIRMNNPTALTKARLFWITTENTGSFTASQTKLITLVPNSDYTVYTLDMSSDPTWTGTIKQLRIDPYDGAGVVSGMPFSIDYIYVTP